MRAPAASPHQYRAAAPPARYRPALTSGPLAKTAGTTSKRALTARLNAGIPARTAVTITPEATSAKLPSHVPIGV